jgi:putative heme-binding domain-containing protein
LSLDFPIANKRKNRMLLSNLKAALAVALLAGAAAGAQGRSGTGPRNPFSNQQSVAEGREIYNRVCTACHGYEGTPGEMAPGLGASGRRYLRTSDQELFDAIKNGIPGTMMPGNRLSDEEAWKTAAYIRSLRGTAIDAPAKGDTARGEQVYWGKGGCSQCHMLRGKGGLLGPDLSNLAGRRKLYSIRDALTKADHDAATDGGRHEISLAPLPNYQPLRVVTRDGKTISGVLKNEETFSLQMMGTDSELHLFQRDELREVVYERKSLMPTDYDRRLTPEEFQDLLAFLSRLAITAPAQSGR